MHRLAFLVYPGFELLDVSGPAAVFNGCNRALAGAGKPAYYRLETISPTGGPIASSSGIVVETIGIDRLSGRGTLTFLVAGAERERLLSAMAEPALRAGLIRLAKRAHRFGSVCTGAFILAACGLLDGHRVATHWDACSPLARAFPAIDVDNESLYVVDEPVWTSAGVAAGIDMALAMAAHDLGDAITGEVAKRLVLYVRRPGHQSQFSPLLRAQAKADSPFGELVDWMQAHLDATLDVPTLAARAGLSERTFHRKFRATMGQTPARFVETARLDAARMLLSRGFPVKSVAVQVGLFPVQRFSEAFERRFGLSPRLFRDMHAVLDTASGAS